MSASEHWCCAAVAKLAHLLGIQRCPRGFKEKKQQGASKRLNVYDGKTPVVFFSNMEHHSNCVFWREMDCISVVRNAAQFFKYQAALFNCNLGVCVDTLATLALLQYARSTAASLLRLELFRECGPLPRVIAQQTLLEHASAP